MSSRAALREHRSTAAGLALVLFAVLIVTTGRAEANHQPADKVVVSANIDEVTFVEPDHDRELLLEETFRTSSTSDLLLQVSSECSITNEVTTVGSDMSDARGQLKFLLTISTDGGAERPIGVVEGDETDGGVVFCDRLYQRETAFTDDEDHAIETFIRTRTANAFNWVQPNAGKGVHTVRLYADYLETTTNTGDAMAVVGRRTMIIEPVKMKNDEHVQDVNVD